MRSNDPVTTFATVAAALLLAACSRSKVPPIVDAGYDAGAAGKGNHGPAEPLDRILVAEQRRVVPLVRPADQQSRDVGVRRAAARALARIGGEATRAGLLHALNDEDGEVVAWGAYGLGFWCKGHETENTSALVARALALGAAREPGSAPASSSSGIDSGAAIPRAIGRCSAEESEPTLVAWLSGPRDTAIASAYALGDLAARKQRLREETLVALLNVAAGSATAPPLPEALFAVGRLEHVPVSVIDRLHEVAAGRLVSPGEARVFAVRALGRAGESAAADLGRVLAAPASFTVAERTEAARSLKRLGHAGQRILAGVLPTLAPSPDPVSLTALVGEDFSLILTVLESITEPGLTKKTLAELESLPSPPEAPPQIARRVSLLRCTSSKLLAGSDYRRKLLGTCDVTKPPLPVGDAGPPAPDGPAGTVGARAMVEVVGREEISGPRLVAYRSLATSGDLRAREGAIELLAEHEEVAGTAEILAAALAQGSQGLASAAASVIAKQPQRAISTSSPAPVQKAKGRRRRTLEIHGPSSPQTPAPAVTKALLAWLDRPAMLNDPEVADPLIEAVGALALKEANPRLHDLCHSSYPTTRERAEKAIILVSGEKKTCGAPIQGGVSAAELDHLVRATTTITVDTDAGLMTLVLDPSNAPVTVTRMVDLARAGYYDGTVIHRVVPGFIAQFGAPLADGFGGPDGKAALRCETSPLPFGRLAVGLAITGRDTGSGQIFVTHSLSPHLDGQYAIIGTAGGPWASLVEGDVIRHASVPP